VAIGSPHDRVLIGRYSGARPVSGVREESGLKSSEEVMEILEAFDLTGTLRGAAELAGCDHKTVAHWVRAREQTAGGLPVPTRPSPRVDAVAGTVEEWGDRSRHRAAAYMCVHQEPEEATAQQQAARKTAVG